MSVAQGTSKPASAPAASPHSQLQTGIFILEGLNALATAYYFNYLFFYMEKHFGFGNRGNLIMTAQYGFFYALSAWYSGRIARKHGYFKLLRIGFAVMALAMAFGGLIPAFFGFSKAAEAAEFAVLLFWTIGLCFTWPMLQSLVSRGQSPRELPHTAGVYNVIWATGAAVAYLTGGALLEWLGGEVLIFWLPAAMHLLQLVLLARYERIDLPDTVPNTALKTSSENVPAMNPRPIAKARTFLILGWIANPFAYIAIYGILPVIPKLTERLGLSTASAGIVCSIWFWTRLGAFIWFWLWPGWHYRFRWLLGAFVTLIGSFVIILLGSQIWMLIVAQIVFGLAVGLIYYSSLYYSMDTGASKSEQGGIHEAAIGLGIFLGPAAGVAALQIFPNHPDAGTYNISGLLVLGLAIFLATWLRNRAN
jgi:predicted MFS family arabinose efflux permease